MDLVTKILRKKRGSYSARATRENSPRRFGRQNPASPTPSLPSSLTGPASSAAQVGDGSQGSQNPAQPANGAPAAPPPTQIPDGAQAAPPPAQIADGAPAAPHPASQQNVPRAQNADGAPAAPHPAQQNVPRAQNADGAPTGPPTLFLEQMGAITQTMQSTLRQMENQSHQGNLLNNALAGITGQLNELRFLSIEAKKLGEENREILRGVARQAHDQQMTQDARHGELVQELAKLREILSKNKVPAPRNPPQRQQAEMTPHDQVTGNLRVMKERLETDFALPVDSRVFPAPYLKGSPSKLADEARILYGDHGPYLELDTLPAGSVKMKEGLWYDHYDLHGRKIYAQKRTVETNPNPPTGPFSCRMNREGGYADYQVGKFYISADAVMRIADTVPRYLNSSLLTKDLSKMSSYHPNKRGFRGRKHFGGGRRGGRRNRHQNQDPMES